MGRKQKNITGQSVPPAKFKCLCEKLRIDHSHLSMTEFAEKLGTGYKQSRLSQFETRAEGPPLELVEQYADFFKLTKEKRYDFFLSALESSNQLDLNIKELSPTVKKAIFMLLSVSLSNKTSSDIIEKRKQDKTFMIKEGMNSDPLEKLEKAWNDLEKAINTFITEGVKSYNLPPVSEK